MLGRVHLASSIASFKRRVKLCMVPERAKHVYYIHIVRRPEIMVCERGSKESV